MSRFKIFCVIATTAILICSFCENTQILVKDKGRLNTLGELTSCAVIEESIFNQTKPSINWIKAQLKVLQRHLEDNEATFQQILHTVPMELPGTSSFQIIKRVTTKLPKLYTKCKKNSLDFMLKPTEKWPTPGDLNNTMLALTHIHRMLRLPLEKLPLRLSGGKVVVDLNAAQAADFAFYAIDQQDFDLAVEWMEWSKLKVMEKEDKTLPLSFVEEYLSVVIQTHNEALAGLPETAIPVFEEPVVQGQGQHNRSKRQLMYMDELTGDTGGLSILPNYWALCSGEVLQPEKEVARLKCYYEKKGVWFLGPLKMEQLSAAVLRIYDFLGEKEIERIKGSQRVKVHNVVEQYKTGPLETWMENKEVDSLTNKVTWLTGWNCNVKDGGAEPLRMVEYVVGRYNETLTLPHKDTVNDAQLALTILFYLNDVEEGGYTAFSNQRVASSPLKGSAVIWPNFYRNGSFRLDVFHAACPVIYGHKIVANKWLVYQPQFRTWPCSLDPNE